ncbi:LAETG motif-containing sortase-dependent surface protein [Streptacidiphilus carbonis]|uniref:LAETG motif-containing sortase-dependent surface protein n=1 Tax=Streptacidiphilus carbonis TaxID=105422 RepID=UPI0009FEBE0B|nr:LAETG motif-containing sortase-dependent surface protein [Streptacidiphilus carbonis]
MATALAAVALSMLTGGTSSAAVPAGQVPHRAEATAVYAVSGHWVAPVKGYLGGQWLLFHRGDTVTLRGKGYFVLRWEIEYWRGTGTVSMPTFTDRQGTFMHVASAGHRMDAPVPGGEAGQTWMGKPSTGYETLPAGTPMIWVNEYYYLDGTITVTCQEAENGKNGRYNLGVAPKSWQQVESDVHPAGSGIPGVVLDADAASPPSASSSEGGTSSGATPSTPVATDAAGNAPETPTAKAAAPGASLASTGASSVTPVLAVAGATLVVLGGGLLRLRRRRTAPSRTPRG